MPLPYFRPPSCHFRIPVKSSYLVLEPLAVFFQPILHSAPRTPTPKRELSQTPKFNSVTTLLKTLQKLPAVPRMKPKVSNTAFVPHQGLFCSGVARALLYQGLLQTYQERKLLLPKPCFFNVCVESRSLQIQLPLQTLVLVYKD